ncbi:MAG: DNA repair protein RecO [Chitinophagaceae bacterium]|nr:DNA repair protein RecO [Chitinophagaceae bacterium]
MAELNLEGLALSCRPLGESDRLLTLLSEEQGLLRLAVPGSRRPGSSLAAAVPLAHLQLQVGRGKGLRRVRQLRVVRNYSGLGQQLEALATAQALAELCLMLVPEQSAAPGILTAVLMHLGRLELLVREQGSQEEALAVAVQGAVHLLALGGYGLPLGRCARSGAPLQPPIGHWDWRCSLICSEGFVVGAVPGARVLLNPSELALLQRLVRPALPRRRDGALMGPATVWLRLLDLVGFWCDEHLGRRPRAFRLLSGAWSGAS